MLLYGLIQVNRVSSLAGVWKTGLGAPRRHASPQTCDGINDGLGRANAFRRMPTRFRGSVSLYSHDLPDWLVIRVDAPLGNLLAAHNSLPRRRNFPVILWQQLSIH
jgi:hypothetical protein